jgi:phosphopantothenoylcysteine decarboxylase/phosphopantothenate--cysteine ligase
MQSSEVASVLGGKRVLVGVSGGIASYKTCTLVSRLAQAGAEVTVLMTPAVTKFVQPLTFGALSGRPVYTSQWEQVEALDVQHIQNAKRADLCIVAPATMDLCAKLAAGICEDVVCTVLAAVDRSATPVILSPSMNEVMWNQPSNQRNLKQLREDGFIVVDPASGWQACRAVGVGRMPEPEDLLALMVEVARRGGRSPAA